MEDNIFERAKREINLKDYIISTYPVKAKGNNGTWNIEHIIPCYDEEENLRFLVARNSKEIISDGTKKTWNIKGIPTYFLNQFYAEGYNIVKGDIIVLTESWGDSLAVESINNNVKVVSLHSVVNVKKLGELLTINREKFDDVKFIIAFNNDKTKKGVQPPGKVATNKAIKIMKALNLEYEVFMPTKYNDLNEWLFRRIF